MFKKSLVINCTKCGACCRGATSDNLVFIFPWDIEPILKKLGVNTVEFTNEYCNSNRLETNLGIISLHVLKHDKNSCIFLDNNICVIYDVRPTQCRKAPFNFFWRDRSCFPHDCINDLEIPDDWSSEHYDRELLSRLFIHFN